MHILNPLDGRDDGAARNDLLGADAGQEYRESISKCCICCKNSEEQSRVAISLLVKDKRAD
jgi:hypothetical protein